MRQSLLIAWGLVSSFSAPLLSTPPVATPIAVCATEKKQYLIAHISPQAIVMFEGETNLVKELSSYTFFPVLLTHLDSQEVWRGSEETFAGKNEHRVVEIGKGFSVDDQECVLTTEAIPWRALGHFALSEPGTVAKPKPTVLFFTVGEGLLMVSPDWQKNWYLPWNRETKGYVGRKGVMSQEFRPSPDFSRIEYIPQGDESKKSLFIRQP